MNGLGREGAVISKSAGHDASAMVGEFAMCRYAFKKYKPHYACLRCHKSFKRRLKEDVDPEGKDRPAQCPQCGLLLADMGLDFKPPPVSKAAAWNTVEALG